MKNRENESKIVKYLLIGISVLFLFVMLVLPLFVVVTEALKKGWEVYVEAVTDSYTIAALSYATPFLDYVQPGQSRDFSLRAKNCSRL